MKDTRNNQKNKLQGKQRKASETWVRLTADFSSVVHMPQEKYSLPNAERIMINLEFCVQLNNYLLRKGNMHWKDLAILNIGLPNKSPKTYKQANNL